MSPPLIRAVERASNTMPIVVLASPDPVLAGFVKSFAHPGGNITGLSFVDEELAAKRLDLLRELVPNRRNVAVFWWGDPKGQGRTAAEKAGQALGLQLHFWELASVDAFEPAFQEAAAAKMDEAYALSYRSSTRTGSGSLNSPRNTGCRRSTYPPTTSARGA